MCQEAVEAIKKLDDTAASSFITCESSSDGAKVVCKFKTIADAHAFHRALIVCGEAARYMESVEQADAENGIPPVAPAQAVASCPQLYWFDPKRGKAWKYDGTYGGDDELILLADIDEMRPIFDVLPRLWATGHRIVEQFELCHLLDKDGNGIVTGKTFRELCVNILLAGV